MDGRRGAGVGELLGMLAALVVVFGICAALYWREEGQIEQQQGERELVKVNLFARLFRNDLEPVANDLRSLADDDGLRAYLVSGQTADLERAVRRAVFISRQQSNYDQLRYVDEHGQEIMRINRGGRAVPAAELQNKFERPYFQKAWALNQGQIFVSALDLNVENGQVEQPMKPMLRFAVPVFDASGRKRGVYVVNYLSGDLIRRLEEAAPISRHRLRVLNDKGYWLKAADPEAEWGFMFPERANFTLAQTDPTLWSQLAGTEKGQVKNGRLFTWQRIRSDQFVTGSTGVVAENEFIVLASEITPEEMTLLSAGLRRIFVVVASVLLVLVVVCTWFVNARQRVLRDLRSSEERLAVTLHSIGDAVLATNAAGEVTQMNRVAEQITGWTLVEARNLAVEKVLQVVEEESRKPAPIPISAVLATGKISALDKHIVLIARDGVERAISSSAAPIQDNQGRVLGVVLVLRDISEKRKADLKLVTAMKELEAFSYSVSHDLRAPLRHIDGFAQLLRKHLGDAADETTRRYLNTITGSAKRLGLLIDELLVFSRMSRTEMRSVAVDSHAIINEIVHELQTEVGDRKIEWRVEALPIVQGDPVMLRQVWSNLLGNAVKYTRGRNPAIIEITHRLVPADGHVFTVKDNGVGFEMKYATKLFGVFERLHRENQFEGTGIGLANVRRIVERHGGRVSGEGVVDQGATFQFTLPLPT